MPRSRICRLPGGGAIVCVSSRAALKPFAGAAGYIVAKAALLAFVDVLAAEYRDDGIRANAILPSVIDTPANRRSMPDADHARWVASGADRRRRALPLRGRLRRRQRRARAGLRPGLTGRRNRSAPVGTFSAMSARRLVASCCLAAAALLLAVPAAATPPLPGERIACRRHRRRHRRVGSDGRRGVGQALRRRPRADRARRRHRCRRRTRPGR